MNCSHLHSKQKRKKSGFKRLCSISYFIKFIYPDLCCVQKQNSVQSFNETLNLLFLALKQQLRYRIFPILALKWVQTFWPFSVFYKHYKHCLYFLTACPVGDQFYTFIRRTLNYLFVVIWGSWLLFSEYKGCFKIHDDFRALLGYTFGGQSSSHFYSDDFCETHSAWSLIHCSLIPCVSSIYTNKILI